MGEREACPTGSSIHHIEIFGQLLPSWDFPLPCDLKFSAFISQPPWSHFPVFFFLHNVDLFLIIPNNDLFCELSGSAFPIPRRKSLSDWVVFLFF